MRVPQLAAAVLACGVGPAAAQSVESDVTPESAHLVKDSSEYAIPQIVSDQSLQSMQYQDAASKAQVGNQRDEFEARSLRLMARGHSLLAEYVRANLSTHDGSSPTVDRYCLTAGWVAPGVWLSTTSRCAAARWTAGGRA
jgi:hypothetical protein